MSQPWFDPESADLSALIEGARSGDPRASEALFQCCREPLLARIRWMMGDEARRLADSDDFLQSTMAAALPALPVFQQRGGESFLRWLTAIARNKIRHEVRRKREEALSALSSAVGDASVRGSCDDGGFSVDSALTLFEALSRLATDERRLIELRDLDGQSFAEIGATLGCSNRHAHRLHAQALLRLSRAFRGGTR